jgi:PAS domain S-box-containing protein
MSREAVPRRTVLVVENNAVTRTMLRTTLAAEGYHVRDAKDARTALELMAGAVPDLVLQDLALPDMDGLDLARRLRGMSGASDVPIVALSGMLTRDQVRALQTHFADFVFKPVASSHLVPIVASHLAGARVRPVTAAAGRHVLVVDDEPVQLKVTKLLLIEAGFDVATAADGAAALEMVRCRAPDAVVSDVLMPMLDGFRLCAALRQMPEMAGAPVVLVSSAFIETADRELAQRVGATALVVRTSDNRAVLEALASALNAEPIPETAPREVPTEEYATRLFAQLERQIEIAASLAQRLSLRAAEVAILSSAMAPSAHQDLAALFASLLERCLDAVGVPKGAAYVLDEDASFSLAAQVGFAAEAAEDLASFFGCAALFGAALRAREPISVPGPGATPAVSARLLEGSGASGMLIVPIAAGDEPLGVLCMATEDRALLQEFEPFAMGVASQLGNAIALRRAFHRAATAEERYRSLFDNVVEGIFQLTPDGRISTANPAMARLLGYESPEALLKGVATVEQLYANREDGAEMMRRLGQDGIVAQFQAQVLRRDGEWIWVRANARAVRDASGAVRGFDGSAEDLTAHWKAEELRRLEERRRNQLQVKDEFISHVSHELRTPLAVIHQFVTILLDGLAGPLGADQQQSLDVVLRNVGQLRGMIDDLLEATRADAGRLSIEPRPIALGKLVADAVQSLRSTAAAKQIALSARVATGLPLALADAERSMQVLFNLVGNAIKFTPEGGSVTVQTAVAPDGRMLCVSVTDTGAGVPLSEKDRVFDYLYQGANVGEAGRRGFGIGLYVAKDLIMRQGGEIWVDTRPGEGSVFSFTLPIALEAGHSSERAAKGKEGR